MNCEVTSVRPEQSFNGLPASWAALYQGVLVADDILDIARDLSESGGMKAPAAGWLGNHDGAGRQPVTTMQLDR